jgi:hypothetical protein
MLMREEHSDDDGYKTKRFILICMIELLDYIIFIACMSVITSQTAAADTAHDATFLMRTTSRKILSRLTDLLQVNMRFIRITFRRLDLQAQKSQK